jgi:hypothetical protein
VPYVFLYECMPSGFSALIFLCVMKTCCISLGQIYHTFVILCYRQYYGTEVFDLVFRIQC